MDKVITLKLRNGRGNLLTFHNALVKSSKYLASGLSDDKEELEVILTSERDLTDLSEFIFMDFAYNFCDKIVSNYFIDKNYIAKIEEAFMMDKIDLINNRNYLIFKSVKKANDDEKFKKEATADILEKIKSHIEEYEILELEGFQNFRLNQYKYYFLDLISHTYDEMMGQEVSKLLKELISNTQLEMEGVLGNGEEMGED